MLYDVIWNTLYNLTTPKSRGIYSSGITILAKH